MRRSNGGLRRTCLFVVAAVGSACATTQRTSQPYFQQTQVDVGLSFASHAVSFDGAEAADGVGFHFYEANGALTKTVIATWLAFLIDSSDRAGRTSTESSYSTSTEAYGVTCQNVVTRTNCAAAGYRSVTTRNVTVNVRPRSPEEQAAYEQAQEAAGTFLDVIPMHTDITYYPDRENGELSGYNVTSYFLALPLHRFFELATGYYWQRLRANVVDTTTMVEETRTHRGKGVPVRLTFQPTSFFALQGEVFLNRLVLDEDVRAETSHGVRFSSSLAVPWMQRLYVRGGVERNRLGSDGTWGSTFEVGARF